jgi:hypothetical protein
VAHSNSVVEIWRRALLRVGSTTLIESITETTPEAYACSIVWDDVLKEALESRAWKWATKQATPAQLDDVERIGWEYFYALPDDCVTPICIILSDGSRNSLQPLAGRTPFTVMTNDDDDGLILCTDVDGDDIDALEYVALIDDVRMMPRLFVDALVWGLTAELFYGLKKSIAEGDDALRKYELALMKAAAYDANIGHDARPPTPGLTARG